MDNVGNRENRRHRTDYYKVPPWDMISSFQAKELNALNINPGITMLCKERDAAIQERNRALVEKKTAFDERDDAINQRDAVIAERDNALRECDNDIASLQFQEKSMNAIINGSVHGMKHNRLIHFDESRMPVPVCSCTGVARHCYK